MYCNIFMLYKLTHNQVHLLIWLMQDITELKVKGVTQPRQLGGAGIWTPDVWLKALTTEPPQHRY